MKIGILTYHCVPNFGAQLQTLSTVCYLRNAGHEPIVLNWYPQDLEDLYASYVPKEQISIHNQFAKKYFPLSVKCRKEDELIKEIDAQNFDAIFLGSDALFKYIPIRRRFIIYKGKYKPRLKFIKVYSVEKLNGNPFFCSFVSKLKKEIPVLAYAVSSENSYYNYMSVIEKQIMKNALSKISFISVRDDWTKGMVENIMHTSNISVVPDPIFGMNHNAEDIIPGRNKILQEYNLSDKYILLSISKSRCSEEYLSALIKEIRDNGYLPVLLPHPHEALTAKGAKTIQLPLSPLDWYALIKFASGYIGERMHPIVVCLHNAIPCFSFDQYGVGTNMDRQIYPRPISYCKESSKIYHIMHRAGVDSNIVSYATMENLPQPSEILLALKQFNTIDGREFSKQQFLQYSQAMSYIIDRMKK